jgi:hypothetical protein
MERADQLIEKYLDEIATPAELAELEALLCSDPAVAGAFAAATRNAGFLAARLAEPAPLPFPADWPAPAPPRWRFLWRSLAAVAVLLGVVLVAVLLWSFGTPAPGYRAGDKRDFPQAGPPDLVGRIEAISVVQGRRTVNGVEELYEETRLRLLVSQGKSEPGTRRTVRLTDRTVRGESLRPAPGVVVRVWLDPRAEDTAIYLERSAD